jgi:hypothetical protein
MGSQKEKHRYSVTHYRLRQVGGSADTWFAVYRDDAGAHDERVTCWATAQRIDESREAEAGQIAGTVVESERYLVAVGMVWARGEGLVIVEDVANFIGYRHESHNLCDWLSSNGLDEAGASRARAVKND